MKIAILGATQGMGRALARAFVQRGDSTHILGRNQDELQKCLNDLKARAPEAKVSMALCDLEQPNQFAAVLEHAVRTLDGLDVVVLTAGLFSTQDELENDPFRVARVLTVDFTNSILFCEAARKQLLSLKGGTLCVFSSVAGDRGRKPVGIYGAAKAGLSHYLDSLDFKYQSQGLTTICVKPGFVKTGMTAGLKPPPFAGEPEGVAAIVLQAIDAKKPVVYAPFMWKWIMLIIRNLPRFVMRRISF